MNERIVSLNKLNGSLLHTDHEMRRPKREATAILITGRSKENLAKENAKNIVMM